MRVVLDSNVLIAAFATHGLSHSLFELCIVDHTLVLSEEILEEVGEKLRDKIKVPLATVKAILEFLRKSGAVEKPISLSPGACRDPNDIHILGLAVASRCDCLVSGDQDLLVLGAFQGIPILSPRAFYQRLQDLPKH